jgi:signal transduction histidine kinase
MFRLLRSTSVRLALGYTASFALSTLLLVGLLWWRTAVYLDRETDAAITADARDIAGQLRQFGVAGAEEAIRLRVAEDPRAVYLLTDQRLRPLAGNLAAWPSAARPQAGWYRFGIAGRGRRREIRLRETSLPGDLHLLVGRNIGDRAEIRSLIIDALGWAGGIALLLAIGGGILLRRSVLRRVEMIHGAAAAIVAGDLSRRVPTRGTADEFDELARTINGLLSQVQQLIEGLRNTANAVAHDLRTPLAELRARLEELLRARPGPEASFEEIGRAVADIDRVIAVFNALLRLSEIDSGARRSGFRRVDVAEIATEVAELYGPLTEEKKADFVVDAPTGLSVQGDPYLLAQAVGNLVDNAVKFAPPRGLVALRVRPASEGHIAISVADNGPGIAEADKPRVIERFYRGRGETAAGIGLGLSVVDAVARLHGGVLSLEDNHPGLVATLTLPAAPAGAEPIAASLSEISHSGKTPAIFGNHLKPGEIAVPGRDLHL